MNTSGNTEIYLTNNLEPWEHLKISKEKWFNLETLENEIWKDIPGYEGFYQASSLGRIKSLDRIVCKKSGVLQKWKGVIKKYNRHYKQYLMVAINKPGDRNTSMVHKFIALTFLENLNNNPVINHKNGIKIDNRVENLEWTDNRANSQHAFLNSLVCARLNVNDVIEIRKLRSQGICCKELADRFGVTPKHISYLSTGKKWSFIPTTYLTPKTGLAKLSEADKTMMKELYTTGNYSYKKLGKMFKVGEKTARKVVKSG